MRSDNRGAPMSDCPLPVREPVPSTGGGRAQLGSLPIVALAASSGLWIVTLSYTASRHEASWAMLLFWAGVLYICLPVMVRLLSSGVTRSETIWLLAVLTATLFLVPALRQPLSIRGFDEFLHWRTADDILRTYSLFTPNSMLVVSPPYPGLEIVTSALVTLTGMSISEAGSIVVGLAHLTMVLSVFLVFEKLTSSFRAAGLGVAVYMGSSTFVFFDTQFAYESLGLPLGAFVIFLLLNRSVSSPRERFLWSVLAALTMLATVVVHHVSAYMLSAFLVLWTMTTAYANRRAHRECQDRFSLALSHSKSHVSTGPVGQERNQGRRSGDKFLVTGPHSDRRAPFEPLRLFRLPHSGRAGNPVWLVGVVLAKKWSGQLRRAQAVIQDGSRRSNSGQVAVDIASGDSRDMWVRQPTLVWLALLLLALNLFWLLSVATGTIAYLAPHAADSIDSIRNLLTQRGGSRDLLGTADTGINYERYVGMASVMLIALGLVVGLRQWWYLRQRPALSIALALSALAYPMIPMMRLFDATWEISNRLSGFIFLGVALVVGVGLAGVRLRPTPREPRRWLLALALGVVICAGIIGGSNPTTRLPGSYMVAADERSIDTQGILAAEWAYRVLGPNNRMAGDRIQGSLMGSFGRQRMVERPSDGVNISGIFLVPELGAGEREIIKSSALRYLVVDRRISTGLPLYGRYFESWEQMVVAFVPPVKLAVLDKFYGMPDVSCVMDSGDIRIYDIGGLSRVP